MRMSLAFRAWLEHEPVWLPPPEADAVLAALRDELPWEQREIVLFGRRILQPRLIAWAGDVGYRYSGQTLEPRPFTPPECPSTTASPTATGTAMIAWGFRPTTSLSSVRIRWSRLCRSVHRAGSSFGLAERTCDSGMTWTWATGSLLIMGGTCQRHYVHGVPRQPGLQSERISLTFRRLLRPP
jgi:alkylated DNA repair dioxygenase AlkB